MRISGTAVPGNWDALTTQAQVEPSLGCGFWEVRAGSHGIGTYEAIENGRGGIERAHAPFFGAAQRLVSDEPLSGPSGSIS